MGRVALPLEGFMRSRLVRLAGALLLACLASMPRYSSHKAWKPVIFTASGRWPRLLYRPTIAWLPTA